MKECEHLPAGIRRICEGQGGLPLERVNQYREKYNAPPLDALPEGAIVREVAEVKSYRKPFENPEPKEPAIGPGVELKAIFERLEIPACQACHELAARMNGWGVAGCRERLEEIIEDMLPRAKEWVKNNRPWIHAMLPGVVEDFGIRQRLRGYVTEAIDTAAAKEAEIAAKKKYPAGEEEEGGTTA